MSWNFGNPGAVGSSRLLASCAEYIPDLIANGIYILNPVQVGAANMNPRALKTRYGKDLIFWGGGD